MEMEFKDLPVSYRIAQGGIASCIVGCLVLAKLGVRNWPVNALWVVGVIAGLVVITSLVVASYVIIRYPYLSLVPSNDFFSEHTSRSTGSLARILGWLALLVLTMFLFVCVMNVAGLMKGNMTDTYLLVMVIYLPLMIVFIGFLTIFYSPERHPVVATFIKVTLGIGILLFPLYLPAICIGSFRCNALLDAEIARQEFES